MYMYVHTHTTLHTVYTIPYCAMLLASLYLRITSFLLVSAWLTCGWFSLRGEWEGRGVVSRSAALRLVKSNDCGISIDVNDVGVGHDCVCVCVWCVWHVCVWCVCGGGVCFCIIHYLSRSHNY